MALILQNIAKHVALTPEEETLFLSKTTTQQHKSKSLLLQAGKVADSTYFVNSGILRSFNINDNIIEHVLHFACEGWWMGDMYSYISGKPGNLFIEVLEDAEIVTITKENHQELYKAIPKLERFFRILAENSLVTHQERLMDNLSLTAEERYEKFCKKYPSLIHKLPQKHIASYIGVTPEFFSKMKSRLLKK
ncbi:cAMP-binding domain of CRP or a regulatory subunit of cAMP-dependent protein kinases [Flavobacterium succinicans]|uniref:cAMP-binding domain of CRP or a regulatory subunit of cAMP-dependent protein kinases n=1 Tax=Flavobacterium succinicans TaxID=29536 RepID=A0A1I4S1G4_9FLAO|nr:Crp/Fnr family transcriptional regulator [Flavobacterium succinicans]SFM58063.1 cAMP-binding domain of CRP or a regulatory subunit of cAMP-dependent protein kinases [Flavobacterium succinicans]